MYAEFPDFTDSVVLPGYRFIQWKDRFFVQSTACSPQKAVELTVTVGCSICLWSGVMEVARQSGSAALFIKIFFSHPLPAISRHQKDSPAAQASLPEPCRQFAGLEQPQLQQGICAVSQFQRAVSHRPLRATTASCSFCLIPASLQLIPTTAACCATGWLRLLPWRFCLLYGWHPFFRSPPVLLPQKEWLILLTQNSLLIPES